MYPAKIVLHLGFLLSMYQVFSLWHTFFLPTYHKNQGKGPSIKDVGSLEGGRGVQIADMGQFDGGRGKKEIQYRQFKIGKSGFFFVKMSKISDVFCGRPRP